MVPGEEKRGGRESGSRVTKNSRGATCWSAGRKGWRAGRVPRLNNRRRL